MDETGKTYRLARERAPSVRALLRGAGLRPTRQRMALGQLLFGSGNRHVSAEMLHEEAMRAEVPVSLATVYNTLHQFTEAGLLREVSLDASKTYFDTNVSDHHHFFVEDDNEMLDVPEEALHLDRLPDPPEGMEISRVDVVIRLRRIAARRTLAD
ncbi:MAG: transcriptional repressor [Bauldia sp.]|nr:transcriptional repressor [Bauldia sp.]